MERSHRSDPDPVELVRGSEADIPSLEPLWVAVHHIHSASMPDLAPYVSDEETWRERRELYRELFRKPKTFLFLARARDELVGYALGHMVGSAESWWSDTRHRAIELASSNRSPCYPSIAGPESAQRCSTPSTPSSRDSASSIRCSEFSRATSTRFVCTNGGGSGRRGSTCPGSPVAMALGNTPGVGSDVTAASPLSN
jgi:hypothetical protein